MALRNAFADLVTEPIARRLNQIVSILNTAALAVDRPNASMRMSVVGGTLNTAINLAQMGTTPIQALPVDMMAAKWALTVRQRIT